MTDESTSTPSGDQTPPSETISKSESLAIDGGQLGRQSAGINPDTVYVSPPVKKRGFHPGLVLATILVVLSIVYAFPTLLMWTCDIPRDGAQALPHNRQVIEKMHELQRQAREEGPRALQDSLSLIPRHLVDGYAFTAADLVMPDGLSSFCILAVPEQPGWAYLYCHNRNGGTFYMQKDDRKGLLFAVDHKLILDGWLPLDKSIYP